ncbi:unnamed protein product [Aureobasidium vineae]|uniref:Uncharacterized protein n=1 Tax=Aureobasidium vineae TaxID=2773715 RepID=A0A9N8P529_9PEZI|nr:unnamed protein product [Aureobasidium vineae]
MSTDFGRKDLSDKVDLFYLHYACTTLTYHQVQEKMTPQSAKGPLDTTKEHATGTADHVARDLKTDDHKSTGQSVHDKVSRMTSSDTTSSDTTSSSATNSNITGANTTTGDHKSVVDKVKDAIPGLHSDKRSDATEVMEPNTSTTTSDYVNKNL